MATAGLFYPDYFTLDDTARKIQLSLYCSFEIRRTDISLGIVTRLHFEYMGNYDGQNYRFNLFG